MSSNKNSARNSRKKKSTLLSQPEVEREFKVIRVAIRRPDIVATGPHRPIQRDIDDPNRIFIPRSGDRNRPLFDRDDILCNEVNYNEEEEKHSLDRNEATRTVYKSPNRGKSNPNFNTGRRSRSYSPSSDNYRRSSSKRKTSRSRSRDRYNRDYSPKKRRSRSKDYSPRRRKVEGRRRSTSPLRPGEYRPKKSRRTRSRSPETFRRSRSLSPKPSTSKRYNSRSPKRDTRKSRSPPKYRHRSKDRSPDYKHRRDRDSRSPQKYDRKRSFDRRRTRSPHPPIVTFDRPSTSTRSRSPRSYSKSRRSRERSPPKITPQFPYYEAPEFWIPPMMPFRPALYPAPFPGMPGPRILYPRGIEMMYPYPRQRFPMYNGPKTIIKKSVPEITSTSTNTTSDQTSSCKEGENNDSVQSTSEGTDSKGTDSKAEKKED